MKNNPNISIVVPVYNSEKTLAELFARIDKVFYDLNKTYQLILVDDGSKDNSWNEIEKLKNNHSEKILAVRFGKNYGQHNAILCGFNYCIGDCVITMDDDLQHPPEEITKLYSKSLLLSSLKLILSIVNGHLSPVTLLIAILNLIIFSR